MSDMASTIIPKSDQLNADDLITGPRTIRITEVKIKGSGEQPISIHYEGDGGKPYKACKSMCRVMVTAWGPDSKAYVGRSMTLYRDPAVTWAGMAVGGIRISHMSDLDSKLTMALTATKQSRKPYTVQQLTNAAPPPTKSSATSPAPADDGGAGGAAPTDDSLIKDIEGWVKRKKFDMAYDLARGISDVPLMESTVARIDKAKAYVEAQ